MDQYLSGTIITHQFGVILKQLVTMVGSGGQHHPRHDDHHHPQLDHPQLQQESGSDSVLYHARAGNLFAIKKIVYADATQANYRRVVTPLMWASYCGHAEIVKFLIAHGAKIDEVGFGHGTKSGDMDITDIDPCPLLASGADATIKRKGGWCALSVASSEAHVAVVKILLSHPTVDIDSR